MKRAAFIETSFCDVISRAINSKKQRLSLNNYHTNAAAHRMPAVVLKINQ